MRRGSALLAWGGLAALLAGCAGARPVEFTAVPAADAAAVKNVHDFRGDSLCQACHVRGEPAPALLRAEPVALCRGCHGAMKGGQHPVAVPAKMDTGGLPLWKGQVTCASCHDPHAIRVKRGMRVAGSELCLKCHLKHGK